MNKRIYLSNVNPIVRTVILMFLTVMNTVASTICSKLFILLVSVSLIFVSDLKIKISKIKNILFFIFISLISNLSNSSGVPVIDFGFFSIKDVMIRNFFAMFSSMTSFWAVSVAMINSTSSCEIPYVAEFLLYPLKMFKVNVSEISMIINLVLRFIPITLRESKNIVLAQESRGANILHGPILRRIKFILPVFVPVFASCFRRAINIATAMECRCYGAPFNRTNLKKNEFKLVDLIFIFIVFFVFCGVLLCNRIEILQ